MNVIKKYFYLDARSLALFRVCLGFTILADLISRFKYIEAFYTDFGTLPRWLAVEKYNHAFNISLHYFSGLEIFQKILFSIHAFFVVLFILGYRTRLMSFICWVFALSIQNRHYAILNSGDVVLRMMLFWSIFLPLGNRYSIDRAVSRSKDANDQIFSMASIAFILQLFFIYIFTGILKTDPIWFPKGEAIAMALELDIFVTQYGIFLRQFPGLLKISTFVVFFFELFGWAIFFIPVYKDRFRFIGVLSFILFHIGIILTMNIGVFPWICIVCWLALIPREFWVILAKKLKRFEGQNFIVFYDSECSFCRKGVLILKEFLCLKRLQLKEAQSDPEVNKKMLKDNSWQVKDLTTGNLSNEYVAFLDLLKSSLYSKFLYRIFSSKPVLRFGTKAYRLVSNNRKFFGKIFYYITSKDLRYRPKIVVNLIVLFFLVVSFVQNFSTLPNEFKFGFNSLGVPKSLNFLLGLIRIDQKWSMFAPFPMRDDGWYVIEGEKASGQKVNLWTTKLEHLEKKPDDVSKTYINTRWRKYMGNLWRIKYKDHRLYFGQYLCRKHNTNKKFSEKLYSFRIHYMLEKVDLYHPQSIERKTIWEHRCY